MIIVVSESVSYSYTLSFENEMAQSINLIFHSKLSLIIRHISEVKLRD